MKKIILIISLSILLFNVKAQIQPVGHITAYNRNSTLNIIDYNGSECFMFFRTNLNVWCPDTIEFYNSDFSLIKQILIKHKYAAGCISQKIFNNNDKIEYIGFKNNPLDIKLFDEDSVVLYDFTPELSVFLPLNGNYISSETKTLNGNKYLLFKHFVNESSIAPSSYPVKLFKITPVSFVNEIDKKQVIVYPNPATNTITLDYKISNNQTLIIYDYFGKLIEQKDLIPNQQSIQIDISQYKQGMYIFKYGDKIGKFIKQ